MEEKFDFENLIAWQKAIDFVDLVMQKTESFYSKKGSFRLKEQLDAALTSIPMNIAEGKGRFSKKEFMQFLYYSRGSINETITLLLILNKRAIMLPQDYLIVKNKAMELSKIINGLIAFLKNSTA